MAQITAAMVKQLREMTDSPMMECKKALVEADGDMDAAVDVLRKNGLAKAAKKAAKAAVKNFTEWMAVHFADMGIRVNAIAPGFFSTKQNATLLWNPDGTPTARTGKILAATPMNRFGEPEELAGTLLFLCDEAYSGFITGVNIPVDGGFNAYSGV